MNKQIEQILADIYKILELKESIVIAIDGMAASGKTTLSKIISSYFDARIIHMDDFFLPLDLRTNERFKTPGGNVHYERFIEEVIPSINGDIDYRRFNCSMMNYDNNIVLKYKPVTIIEGSYSTHPLFGKYYDYLIFTEIDNEKQINRILCRDGEKLLQMFIDKWLKYECLYFDTFNIKQNANIIIKDMDVLNDK